jgi:hypothetical protein
MRGKKKMFTEAELKAHKKEYDLRYQRERYQRDADYREAKRNKSRNYYQTRVRRPQVEEDSNEDSDE